MVALNVRWNLIYLKSQGNRSLVGAEWLSSLHPLTGRDVVLRKDHRDCAGIMSARRLCLCLKQRPHPNSMYVNFKTQSLEGRILPDLMFSKIFQIKESVFNF